jgi:hypothetical protein
VTAAERAAEVIRAAIAHNACCDECAALPDAPWAVDARLARDALMADPALLVDLAIEAGALVRLSDTFAWKPDPDWPGCAIVNTDGPNGRVGDNWQPLYRRTTQENGQP